MRRGITEAQREPQIRRLHVERSRRGSGSGHERLFTPAIGRCDQPPPVTWTRPRSVIRAAA